MCVGRSFPSVIYKYKCCKSCGGTGWCSQGAEPAGCVFLVFLGVQGLSFGSVGAQGSVRVSGICGAGAGSDPSDTPASRQGCAGARMSPLRCEPPCRGSQHLWGLRAGPSLAVPGAREGSRSQGSEEEFGAPQPGTLSLSPRSLIRSVLQLGARISTLRRHVEHLFRSS